MGLSPAWRGAAEGPSCSSPLRRDTAPGGRDLFPDLDLSPRVGKPHRGDWLCPGGRGGANGSRFGRHQLFSGDSRDVFIRGPTVNPHGQGTSGLVCRSRGCRVPLSQHFPETCFKPARRQCPSLRPRRVCPRRWHTPRWHCRPPRHLGPFPALAGPLGMQQLGNPGAMCPGCCRCPRVPAAPRRCPGPAPVSRGGELPRWEGW